jgi:hypothetical protein
MRSHWHKKAKGPTVQHAWNPMPASQTGVLILGLTLTLRVLHGMQDCFARYLTLPDWFCCVGDVVRFSGELLLMVSDGIEALRTGS